MSFFILAFLILKGYLGSFLARGDSIIITVFVPLWVYKYYIDEGSCHATDPNDPDVKESCKKAYITAAILSGVAQTLALVGAPIFGSRLILK